MKNRTVGILLALLICLPLLVLRAQSHDLLKDSDTNFLIFKLNEYNNPLRWFTHDWPLENHFYRPISTLFFEFDNRLHPGSSVGFGFTNALICVFASLSLYWLLCELKRSIPVALAGTALFVMWTLNGWFLGYWLPTVVSNIPFILFFLVLIRMVADRRFRWDSLITAVAGGFVWNQITPNLSDMSNRTMYWLPGRTATSMTIFALVALASYVRFERLGAASLPQRDAGPLDPPATRSNIQRAEPYNAWGWLILSAVASVIALGAYEQAVMIPTLIFMLGVWLRVSGYQTRFAFQTLFWALLVGYLIYRVQIIPVQPSGYQKQQFRTGAGFQIDILNYVLPGYFGLTAALSTLAVSFLSVLNESFWSAIGSFASNVSAWFSIRKAFLKPALALALALFAYLPMAFLKQFGHYHYLPAAILTLFVISLFESYWPKLISAVSPQAIQAPKRLDRAPGSLPRL